MEKLIKSTELPRTAYAILGRVGEGGGSFVPARVTSNGDGTYSAVATLRASGRYAVHVRGGDDEGEVDVDSPAALVVVIAASGPFPLVVVEGQSLFTLTITF